MPYLCTGVNEGLPNKRVNLYTIFGFSFKFYMKYFTFIFCTISSFSFKFDIRPISEISVVNA